VAVSSATDSTFRHSPNQIFCVEVLGEPATKFQRLEEWCSRLEWFAANICDPLLRPPPGRPRLSDRLDEAARQLRAEVATRQVADAELEALQTSVV
jgi:hypothetical protein